MTPFMAFYSRFCIIFIRVKFWSIQVWRPTIYVDDIFLYRIMEDLNLGVEELQDSINSLSAWLTSMGITISELKSHLCCFSRDDVDRESISLDIEGQRILCENHVKYLGIILDSSLN